jgi:hypothetical protein
VPGHLQADIGICPERKHLLSPFEAIAESPPLGTVGSDQQKQAATVGQLVRLGLGFGFSAARVVEHGYG